MDIDKIPKRKFSKINYIKPKKVKPIIKLDNLLSQTFKQNYFKK